jgi:osmotically-inducible protein OsmY
MGEIVLVRWDLLPCRGSRLADDSGVMTTTTRTDPDLHRDVVDELAWTPNLDGTGIVIAVDHGVVTLSGDVASYPERLIAENAALRIVGVAALADEITVRHTWAAVTDTDLARDVGEALARAIDVPADSVKATVHDHIVVLSGTTAWNFQRLAATRAVRHLKGVRAIQNRVTLKPTVSPDGIRAAISAALARDAQLEARDITVTSNNGEVVLEGEVRSWSERHAADNAAWSAPGVTHVVSKLRVV